MRIRNVHQRLLPGPPERVGALIDDLAGPADRLWPGDRWPSIRLDRPLGPGAEGGHGSIRYRVEDYQPGRRVTFRFTGMPGVDGGHRLEAEPAGEGAVALRHAMELRLGGRMLVTWPLVLRPLHDAMLEDLLDRAELAVTGSVARPARWSAWVRLVRGGSARVRRLRRLRSRRARSGLSGRGGPGYGAGPAPARGTGTGSRSPAGAPGGRAG